MIRDGKPEDIPDIVRMAEDFWQHTAYEESFDAETVEGMALYCIDSGLMAVLEIAGKVCGFCCGVKGPLLANKNIFTGSEIAWWVDKDHRGGRNSIGLLKGIEQRAKAAGCKYWHMMFMESSMPETVERIYRKMGYSKVETSYMKRLA
tara:strand:+ start:892 stop:1335 length:444 start_codon:yes stop_codon:yes gene_type:complete